jgi:hypothetical protein
MYKVYVVRGEEKRFFFFKGYVHEYHDGIWSRFVSAETNTKTDVIDLLASGQGFLFGTLPDCKLWYIDQDLEEPFLLKSKCIASSPTSKNPIQLLVEPPKTSNTTKEII